MSLFKPCLIEMRADHVTFNHSHNIIITVYKGKPRDKLGLDYTA